MIVPPIVVLPVVPTLEPVMCAIMAPFKIAMKAAVVPPAYPVPMGARVLVPELVVRSMVALFETVVLAIMPVAPAAVVRKRRNADAQSDHRADQSYKGRTH